MRRQTTTPRLILCFETPVALSVAIRIAGFRVISANVNLTPRQAKVE